MHDGHITQQCGVSIGDRVRNHEVKLRHGAPLSAPRVMEHFGSFRNTDRVLGEGAVANLALNRESSQTGVVAVDATDLVVSSSIRTLRRVTRGGMVTIGSAIHVAGIAMGGLMGTNHASDSDNEFSVG